MYDCEEDICKVKEKEECEVEKLRLEVKVEMLEGFMRWIISWSVLSGMKE